MDTTPERRTETPKMRLNVVGISPILNQDAQQYSIGSKIGRTYPRLISTTGAINT